MRDPSTKMKGLKKLAAVIIEFLLLFWGSGGVADSEMSAGSEFRAVIESVAGEPGLYVFYTESILATSAFSQPFQVSSASHSGQPERCQDCFRHRLPAHNHRYYYCSFSSYSSFAFLSRACHTHHRQFGAAWTGG